MTFPSPAEREALPYRSKKALTGAVRLTEFPGADLCACCGTHVSGSGQVGLVKFLSCQKLREGVRLELVCGGRAMAHLCRSWQQNRSIGQQLSVKPGDTSAAVERQGREVLSLKTRCAGLEEELFRLLAEQYRDAGEVLLVRHNLAGDGTRTAVRRREPYLRRAVRRVLRRGGAVSVRRHPSGSRPAGVREAYERRPLRSGRRTQRLRSGKRRRR